MSEFNRIIAELEQRKVNIERALAILKDLDSTDSEPFEQQPGPKTRTSRKTVKKAVKSTKRTVSPEARANMARAQKARYAVAKKATKKKE